MYFRSTFAAAAKTNTALVTDLDLQFTRGLLLQHRTNASTEKGPRKECAVEVS